MTGKKHYLKNRDKISIQYNEYNKNRLKRDVNFRLFHNTRPKNHHALNGKLKSSSTMGILGKDIITYRKRIEFQMTAEMNWQNIEVDHVKTICLFDVSKDEELKVAFN